MLIKHMAQSLTYWTNQKARARCGVSPPLPITGRCRFASFSHAPGQLNQIFETRWERWCGRRSYVHHHTRGVVRLGPEVRPRTIHISRHERSGYTLRSSGVLLHRIDTRRVHHETGDVRVQEVVPDTVRREYNC